MLTFITGIAVLVIGGFFYGKYCEKLFSPDDRPTPAYQINDGVDYVPMNKWKNALIELLNIAGTGPILGPIQGILFGPIAFITIPVGCILGGALHDYMSGMISVRNQGEQIPSLIKKSLGKNAYAVYSVLVFLLSLLVCTVFIYTPSDIFVGQILKQDTSLSNAVVWIVIGMIVVYYIIATFFPIDKIIGKVYPIFGGVLILSTIGIFISLFTSQYKLNEIWQTGIIGVHPDGLNFIPIFFITIACGMLSGFHATQSALVARTLKHEKEGKTVFFYPMIAEGFIALVWAAAAMGTFNNGTEYTTSPLSLIGIISIDLLGNIGGVIAMIGIIILAVTTGDTTSRSLRLMLAELFKLDQKKVRTRLLTCLVIFGAVVGLLIFAKLRADGFNILWRYVAWANQTIAIFTFTMISVYLIKHGKNFIMSLIPGTFYFFVIMSYILNAKIGFNMPWTISYIISAVTVIIYVSLMIRYSIKFKYTERGLQ